jgi:hypothetical protein
MGFARAEVVHRGLVPSGKGGGAPPSLVSLLLLLVLFTGFDFNELFLAGGGGGGAFRLFRTSTSMLELCRLKFGCGGGGGATACPC